MQTFLTTDGSCPASGTQPFDVWVGSLPVDAPAGTDSVVVVKGGNTVTYPMSAVKTFVGGGGSPVVRCIYWSPVVADIAETVIFTPTQTGLYQILIYATCTVASSGTPGFILLSLFWTDDSGPVTEGFGNYQLQPVGPLLLGQITVELVAGQPLSVEALGGNPYNGGEYSLMIDVVQIGTCTATAPPAPPPSTLPIVQATPGSYTGVVPTGVTTLSVTLTGGGGDGGIGSGGLPSGGGGGGACATITLTVAPGDTFNYTVPGPGGNAVFSHGSTSLTCTGGATGTIDGGPGGSVIVSGPYLTYTPFFGGSGNSTGSAGPNYGGSGGGGGAGDTGAGGMGSPAVVGVGGAGGAAGTGSVQPGGGGGAGATYGASAGVAGTAPGGGGGGDSADNQGPGAGSNGQVTISGS